MCHLPLPSRARDTLDPGNADVVWNTFDSEAYFEHYYGEPHPDDDELTRLTATALLRAPPRDRLLDVLDVGTGPSLIPLLAALPRARSLTAWEHSHSNIVWLKAELSAASLRPQWHHFWQIARAAHAATAAAPGTTDPLPADPLPSLALRASVRQGSLFDLPRATWDAATMFFCAESITARRSEFEAALDAVTGAVRPGGLLVAAFLVHSDRYDVAGRRFPALKLSAEEIEACLASRLARTAFARIGISATEIRSGYSGALFASGLAPSHT